MIRQRLYLLCPVAVVDALETAVSKTFGPGWLRLNRANYKDTSVASLQATDEQAAQLEGIVLLHPGVVLLRGPDDDGPRPGDKDVGVGDVMPTDVTKARLSWPRVESEKALIPADRAALSVSASIALKGQLGP